MSAELLEAKITELTRRLEQLEAKQRPVAKDTWREAFGTLKDDEISREAERLGALYRAEQSRAER
jgi:hypothetical protein